MKVLVLEIRDRATFIPAVAVEMSATPSEASHYLLRRAGYSCHDVHPFILLTRMSGGSVAHYDSYDWNDRTWAVAHRWIYNNWQSLKDGDVVDVEHILGETTEKKLSERELNAPY